MNKIDYKALASVVENGFDGRRIFVVGDVMLDENVYGTASRMSSELPIPVFLENLEKEIKYVAGGAANVWKNLLALSPDVEHGLVGVIGDDKRGEILSGLLMNKGGNDRLLIDKSRPTTTKTRLWANVGGNYHQISRRDRESSSKVNGGISMGIHNYLLDEYAKYDAIVFVDYDKGILTREVCNDVMKLCRDESILIMGDIKPQNIGVFYELDLLKPNLKEAIEMTESNKDSNYLDVADRIARKYRPKNIVMTLGPKGMFYYQSLDKNGLIQTDEKKVEDVTGAGDSCMAALALSFGCGLDLEKSCVLANKVGRIAIQKHGTSVVTKDMLLEELGV